MKKAEGTEKGRQGGGDSCPCLGGLGVDQKATPGKSQEMFTWLSGRVCFPD